MHVCSTTSIPAYPPISRCLEHARTIYAQAQIHVHTHAHINICYTHMHAHTHKHSRTQTHTHTLSHTITHTLTHTRTRTRTRTPRSIPSFRLQIQHARDGLTAQLDFACLDEVCVHAWVCACVHMRVCAHGRVRCARIHLHAHVWAWGCC